MITVVIPPATEVLYLDEIKQHLRIEDTEQDAYLHALNAAARQHVENVTGRQLITATLDMALESFPSDGSPVLLDRAPVQSVTSVSVGDEVVDADTYTFSQGGIWRPRLILTTGSSWPSLPGTVRYVAGFGNRNAVPTPLKLAMLLLVGHWFSNREAVATGVSVTQVPMAVASLLTPYRIFHT